MEFMEYLSGMIECDTKVVYLRFIGEMRYTVNLPICDLVELKSNT
jgi:hypothetical protein